LSLKYTKCDVEEKQKTTHKDKIRDRDRYNLLGNNPSTYLETQIERDT